MEITKPNDIFVTSVVTPDVNAYDLLKSNIQPENTSFFDKETYKNSDFVKKAFTDNNGKFDDLKFNEAYTKASKLFTELSNDKFLKNNLEWDAYDFMRPLDSKTKKESVEIEKDVNPYGNLYGRTSLHSVDPGKFSMRELAQQSQIFDTKEGKFLDKTANDLGLLGSLFGETMVYAQWDEDGVHTDPSTGREVKHRKGENKLNPDGNFYIETLGDREIYGKQVVNPTDLITTDGSYFNKVDFWDSDGKEKSIIGTTFKVATQIAPFLIPGVAVPYGTFKMVVGLSSALPTFYKALEGIIGGDNSDGNETSLWKAATKTEGFLSKYTTESFSEKGTESMWNYEQLSQMLASTFSQIYEQRAAANLSKYFYKINDPEYSKKLVGLAEKEILSAGVAGKLANKQTAERVGKAASEQLIELSGKSLKSSGMAKALSLGYMALTSTSDIYHEALSGGYDRRTAGLAAILAAGGQYAIMNNNRMATWFLDDAVGFNTETSRAEMKTALKPLLGEIEKGVKVFDVNKDAGKKALVGVIGKAKNAIRNILVEPISSSAMTERLYKNSITEGVEEVTEQMVLDATKGIVDTMSWLGLTGKQGSFNTVDKVFSGEGVQNYLANFVGGLLGGGVFELHRMKTDPLMTGQAVDPKTNYALIRMISNGKAADLKAEIDRMYKAVGNDELAPLASDQNGEKVYLSDNVNSQASIIAQVSKQYIDYIDGMLNSENLKQDDESVIRKAVLNEIRISDLEDTGIDGFILSDFNELTKEILDIKAKLVQSPENADTSELMSKLNEKKLQVQDLLSGKWAEEYKALSLFSLNRDLHAPFVALNVLDYAKYKYNVDYKDLPEDGATLTKKMVDQEFKDIMENGDNKKDKMKVMFAAFKDYIGKYSNNIGDYAEEKHLRTREKYVDILTNANLLTAESVVSLDDLTKKAQLSRYNLSNFFNLPLGDLLVSHGYLDVKNLSEEEKQAVITELNTQILPLENVNIEFINGIINNNKIQKLEGIADKIRTEAEETGIDPVVVAAKYAEEVEKIHRLTPTLSGEKTMEILPLDLIYLTQELANDPDIPMEVMEVLNSKLTDYLERLKAPIKDIYFNEDDILERYAEDPEFDPAGLKEAVAEVNAMKATLLASKSVKELNDNIAKFRSYVDKYPPGIIKTELDGSFFGITQASDVFLQAEKLLSKNVIDSRLGEILKNLNIELYSGEKTNIENILDILNEELKVLGRVDSPSDYVRSKDVTDDLKRAMDTLGLLRAIGTAMLDSSINASNPYGFNVSLINGLIKNEREGEASKFRVINSEAYELLNKEITRLQTKFKFLIDLSEINQSTIASAQEAIKNNNVKLLLNIITNENNELSPLNLSIGDKKLLEKEKLSKILGTAKTDEEKLYDIEEELYKSFNTSLKTKGVEALDELFAPFKTNGFKKEVENYANVGFTKNSEVFNSLDYFNYLHSILSLNSKDFLNNYKKIIEKEVSLQDDKKAPFFAQEYCIRYISAYRANKRVMGHSQEFIDKLVGSGRINLRNMVLVTGSGGVGKTTVISNMAMRLDEGKNVDFLVSAPSETILNKLKNDISRNTDIAVEAVEKVQLMKNIIGEDLYRDLAEAMKSLEENSQAKISNSVIKNSKGEPIIEIKDYGEWQIKLHPEFVKKISSSLSKEKDTVLFIDEVSWFNPLELEVLDIVAGLEGSKFYVIGLGDELQNGYSLNNDKPFSLESFYYNHPPKLKGVVRANNLHKKDNIETTEDLLNKSLSDIVLSTTYLKDLKPQINYTDTVTLEGDKFVDTLTASDLEKLDKTKEIAVITDKGTLTDEQKEVFKAAGISLDNLLILPKNNIQGREFEQVVTLFKIPFNEKGKTSTYRATKVLYTALSRGKKSSLIVGNGKLVKALNIINVKKGSSPKVELMGDMINSLLEKRHEFLNKVTADYVPTETPVSEEILQEEKEADLNTSTTPEVEPGLEDNNQEEVAKTQQEEHDGDNTFLLYSFYNVLNAYISKVDHSLTIKEWDGTSPLSDMQILEYAVKDTKFKNKSPEEIINQFIIAKNHILHGVKIPVDNLFSDALQSFNNPEETQLVVRRMTHNEYTEPYGKQAHMRDSSGKSRANEYDSSNYFLAIKSKVFDLEGNLTDAYITLGGLPNINNGNWRQEKNKLYLQEIYNLLESQEEVPVEVDLNALTGIRIIYEDGTSKKPTTNNIVISGNTLEEFKQDIQQKMPGVITSDLNNITVFGDDVQYIQDQFRQTGYDLGNAKGDIKGAKALRFRPFIRLSYIDPNNNEYSKIMVLNTKHRDLLEAKYEYERIKQEWKSSDKGNKVVIDRLLKTEFPALISRWDGLLLFCDVMKYFKNNNIKELDTEALDETITPTLRDKYDIIWDKILNLELDSVEHERQKDVYDTLENMLGILEEAEFDIKRISPYDQRLLMGRLKGQTRLSNFGLRILDVLTEDEIKMFSPDRQVYYNTLWESSHEEAPTMLMNGKFLKYFQINCFLEPPIFKASLKLASTPDIKPTESPESSVEEKEISEENTGTSNILKAKNLKTPFNTIDGKPLIINIDVSQWKTEDDLHILVASLNSALTTVKDNIAQTKRKMLSSGMEIANVTILETEIMANLTNQIKAIISNPAFINSSKELNLSLADMLYNKINSELSDELVDFIYENDLELRDLFVNSSNMKLITEDKIDKQINAEICK